MQRTTRVELDTAVHVTFKLMRILLAHELECGRLTTRRLRELASEVEERSLDSKDTRDVTSAALLRDVVKTTITTLARQRRLPVR